MKAKQLPISEHPRVLAWREEYDIDPETVQVEAFDNSALVRGFSRKYNGNSGFACFSKL